MSKVGIFFTEGFEEIEGLTPVDVLDRAGIEVTMISVTGEKAVTGSHKITILTDALFEHVDFGALDGLVLPGGPGTKNLLVHEGVNQKIKEFHEKGKLVAAICAAPTVLAQAGLLKGRRAIAFPGNEEKLAEAGAKVVYEEVVRDGTIITSRAMGTATPFALALVEYFLKKEKSEEIRKSIVFREM